LKRTKIKLGPALSRILGQKLSMGVGNDSTPEGVDFDTHFCSFP